MHPCVAYATLDILFTMGSVSMIVLTMVLLQNLLTYLLAIRSEYLPEQNVSTLTAAVVF